MVGPETAKIFEASVDSVEVRIENFILDKLRLERLEFDPYIAFVSIP
jgi:hypothetical protein